MKTKVLLNILIIVLVLLFYNMFCYFFVNRVLDNGTKNIINSYFNNSCSNCDFSYEYLKATNNEDGTINIFVKVDSKYFDKYYRFIVFKNGPSYQLKEVNNTVPAYIK